MQLMKRDGLVAIGVIAVVVAAAINAVAWNNVAVDTFSLVTSGLSLVAVASCVLVAWSLRGATIAKQEEQNAILAEHRKFVSQRLKEVRKFSEEDHFKELL